MALSDSWAHLKNRRLAVMLPLGFASGLPLALTAGTLQAWLTVVNVDLRTIGLFTLVGLPYTLKFLWAPVMDRFVPPWLGRRRGWMIVMQLALTIGIAAMALVDPTQTPLLLASLAILVAVASASQDIVFDAYRTDVLKPVERGFGAAVSVTGYRIAMLMSGAGALILSTYLGWSETYFLIAGLMLDRRWGDMDEPGTADARQYSSHLCRGRMAADPGILLTFACADSLVADHPIQAGRCIRGLADHGVFDPRDGLRSRRGRMGQ